MDWVYELERSSSTQILHAALDPLLPKRSFFGGAKQPRYIQAPEATIALAAAEVIAALAGRPGKIPEEVATWVGAGGPSLTPDLAPKARLALTRIMADSELKELWEESGEFESWSIEVQSTLSRLG